MERDAVDRVAARVLRVLDLDAVGVVRADLVQRDEVRGDQAEQHQRHGDDVEAEEAVQRRVADDVVAADQQRQVRADEGDRREQVDDHLRAPVAHLAPGQQVAHEGLGHQAQEDAAAEQPDQLARLAVAAVEQAAEHVQVDDDEERRRARRVHVADEPAPRHVAHDVLDRLERLGGVGLVVHRQEDAGEDLHHQHEQRQRAEDVPEVEVLRRVVLRHVLVVELGEREAVVDPGQQPLPGAGAGGRGVHLSHSCSRNSSDAAQARFSSPMRMRLSDRYMCGGTSRLSGAGLSL